MELPGVRTKYYHFSTPERQVRSMLARAFHLPTYAHQYLKKSCFISLCFNAGTGRSLIDKYNSSLFSRFLKKKKEALATLVDQSHNRNWLKAYPRAKQ